jgi:hypothetical protein
MRLLLLALFIGLSPTGSAAQERWAYPSPASRRNPVAPPAELYNGELAPPLIVTSVMGSSERELHAVVRLGEPLRERRLVRSGARIGPYLIDTVQLDGLWVRLYVLGSPRRMFIPRAGLRRQEPA